jgi:hypothetical protein
MAARRDRAEGEEMKADNGGKTMSDKADNHLVAAHLAAALVFEA